MKLTSADLARLQSKEVSNAVRIALQKLQAGKTLSRNERTLLAQATVEDEVQTSGIPQSAFAKTWDELAEACHIDRRTLTNARAHFTRDIKAAEKQWSRADGRKEIAWWIRFLEEKGVRGRGVNNPEIDYVDERQLRLRREMFQLKKAEWEFEKAKEMMLPVADYQAALSRMVSAFVTTINQVPGRAGQKIVSKARHAVVAMLREVLSEAQFAKIESALDTSAIEYGDIQHVIELELEHARRTLASGDFLDGPADSSPAECPLSPPKPSPSSAPSSPPRSRPRRAKKSGASSKG